MKLEKTRLGAALIRYQHQFDERGSFTRTWCRAELAEAGFAFEPIQTNLSKNSKRGTLRGIHYQAAPHEEAKLVQIFRGRVFDVIVDIRDGSPTRGRWESFELDHDRALFIPAGFAHGFQTLEDDVWIQYQMSAPYVPATARGLRWNDPALSIDWPIRPPIVSERDQAFALVEAAAR